MNDAALLRFRNVVVFCFLASLVVGLAVPVYTDEVAWRFLERAGFDGVDKGLSDLCGGANPTVAPPFFMAPARYFSAFFNAAFAEPFFIRLAGVGYEIFWALLLLRLIGRIASDGRERNVLALIAFGLLGLGVLPLLLVWSRPEQPIILAATAAIAVACLDGRKSDVATPAAAASLRSIFILFLGLIAISYHVKGLVLIPLFVACLFFCSQGRNATLPRFASAVVLFLAAGFAAHYWVGRLQCSGDSAIAAQAASQNLGIALTGPGDWRKALWALVGNIGLMDYFGLAVPTVYPMSNWLAPSQVTLATSSIWYVLVVSSWFVAVLGGVFYLASASFEGLRTRKLDRDVAMSTVLFGSVLVWSAPQLVRNDYEASFVLPLLILACLFAFAGASERLRQSGGLVILALFLGAFSIGSEILIARTYGPALVEAFHQKGYLREQPWSLAVTGYAELKPDILAAAGKCGITPDKHLSGLLVDDLTYFAFIRSSLPQHRMGVLSGWNGSLKNPVDYLRSIGSSGMIIGCRFLTEDLRRRARSEGEFCCLGPPDW
jgi:hypothetical protein